MCSPYVWMVRISVCAPIWFGLATSDCYYPNGTPHSTAVPCNASAPNSACCGPGDICLSNNYCFQQSGAFGNRLARGTCTDIYWTSPQCPQFCADVAPTNSISLYLANDTINGTWCCSVGPVPYDASSGLCAAKTLNSNRPFVLPPGQAIYNRSDGAIVPATLSSAPTVTVTAAAKKSNDITPVAAGIAVPLGILLLAALATMGILWSKLRKARRQPISQQPTPAVEHHPPLAQPPMSGYYPGVPQGPPQPHTYQQPLHEAPISPKYELPVETPLKEAPASSKY